MKARAWTSVCGKVARTMLVLGLSLSIASCGGDSASGGSSEATGAAFAMPSEIKIPTVADSGGSTTIDTSGVSDGWVGVRATRDARLKFQVVHGDTAYNYDLPNDGTPTCYPINMGNGSYAFRIMENVEGSSYAEVDSASADITLGSETLPYLVPNLYCNYTASSSCVQKATELMSSVSNQGEAVREICTYVAENISYDYDKAQALSQSSGYIPNADETLASGLGVCFDYACLTAAMLRSMGLPAQVVTGYVSPCNLYLAWTMVYVDGTWQTAQFSVSPNTWSRCDVTFASAGSSDETGDGKSYTNQYIY